MTATRTLTIFEWHIAINGTIEHKNAWLVDIILREHWYVLAIVS